MPHARIYTQHTHTLTGAQKVWICGNPKLHCTLNDMHEYLCANRQMLSQRDAYITYVAKIISAAPTRAHTSMQWKQNTNINRCGCQMCHTHAHKHSWASSGAQKAHTLVIKGDWAINILSFTVPNAHTHFICNITCTYTHNAPSANMTEHLNFHMRTCSNTTDRHLLYLCRMSFPSSHTRDHKRLPLQWPFLWQHPINWLVGRNSQSPFGAEWFWWIPMEEERQGSIERLERVKEEEGGEGREKMDETNVRGRGMEKSKNLRSEGDEKMWAFNKSRKEGGESLRRMRCRESGEKRMRFVIQKWKKGKEWKIVNTKAWWEVMYRDTPAV